MTVRRTAAVPAAFIAAVALLLASGRGVLAGPPADPARLGAWVDELGSLTAAFVVVRLGALLVAAWLALTTSFVVAVRAAGARRLADTAGRVLPPAIRRAVGVGMASAVALGSAACGAAPAARPSGEQLVLLPGDGTGTAVMSVLPEEPAPSAVPAPAPPQPEDWVVAPGESFWSIAEDVLAETLGRPPSDAEVAPYWRALIDANRDRLLSGDPDIVHVGQVFVLPPR